MRLNRQPRHAWSGGATRRFARVSLLAGAAVAAASAGGLGGCYERVVSARGMGADQYRVSEPYQENSKLDDWVFGERPPTRNNTKLRNMTTTSPNPQP